MGGERKMMKLMRKQLSNQRGVTLIELLAVIVILGILAAVAVPVVLNQIDDAETNANDMTKQIIIDAAQRYVINKSISSDTTIEVTTLIDEGYLKNNIDEDSSFYDDTVDYTKANGKLTYNEITD